MNNSAKFFIFGTFYQFAGATGIEQAYHDATAAARGNAFAATADTPAAVHYNPGGLAWQDELAVQGTFFGTWSDTEFRGAVGRERTTDTFKATGALFATVPLDKVTLGFGLTCLLYTSPSPRDRG